MTQASQMLQTSFALTKTYFAFTTYFDNFKILLFPSQLPKDENKFVTFFPFVSISFKDLDDLMVSFKVIQLKRKTIVYCWFNLKTNSSLDLKL